jgi:hypothetical protein
LQIRQYGDYQPVALNKYVGNSASTVYQGSGRSGAINIGTATVIASIIAPRNIGRGAVNGFADKFINLWQTITSPIETAQQFGAKYIDNPLGMMEGVLNSIGEMTPIGHQTKIMNAQMAELATGDWENAGYAYGYCIGGEVADVTMTLAPYGVGKVGALKSVFTKGLGSLFTKSATKEGSSLFGKEALKTTTRMGRDGKAVEVIFKDGSKIDINGARVKQWTPNTHPSAPKGTLQKVKFDNSLPGTKGYKRTPTQSELNFLYSL